MASVFSACGQCGDGGLCPSILASSVTIAPRTALDRADGVFSLVQPPSFADLP